MARKPHSKHQPLLPFGVATQEEEPPEPVVASTDGDRNALQDHRSRTASGAPADCTEQLRRRKMLLKAMEFYARMLKDMHESRKLYLAQARPGSDESQIASEALEMALQELEDSLPSVSSSEDGDRPSLDDLMTFLRADTPPA